MLGTASALAAQDCARDDRLRIALDLHLHPRHGSAFWLARQESLGRDLRREVRSISELHLLGRTSPAELRGRSVWDFVPRGLWNRRAEFVTGETGGTSGPPLPTAFSEDEFYEAFVAPFLEVADRTAFPRGEGWLFLGPSGPHVIGLAARRLARELDSPPPWFVDFDPRWAKQIASGSLAARRYLEHVLDQALRCVEREVIRVVFATPPVLRGLAQRLDDARREAIRGVHYGGLPVSPDELNEFRLLFPRAVHLSGYGNSLFGCAMEVEDVPRKKIDYFPCGPRLVFEVLPGEAETAERRGRVVFHRFDRSMLLIGMEERDWAELVPPSTAARSMGFSGCGLRDPGPPPAPRPELKIGIY
ncbi:MAG TPA: hypothetical protein VND64_05665 [Pirellulales bacterium]|nr:hypothetical protein [Pirellulales bacterium]